MVIHVSYSGVGRGGVSVFVSPEAHYYSSDILLLRLVYGLHDQGFESRQGKEIFLFSKNVQIGSGATQPPIQ